jgi:EmrB/QacA subfamily drug resistance transporter
VGILIAARAMQGIGAALVMPISLTILTAAFPAQRRGAIVGIWGGIAGLAVAGGPLIGGAVTQGFDWHWIFWVNVPIGIAAAVMSVLRLHESHGAKTRLDLPAVALVSGGAMGIVWALVRASDAGWGSVETIGTFTAGVLLMIGFVAWESRAVEPMLPLRLFRSRTFVAANLTAFLMIAALFSAAFLASQYFQFVLRQSPFDTGLRFLPWTATPILVAPAAGALSDRIGRRPLMFTGMALQGVGLVWLAATATTTSPYSQLVLPLLVGGIGVSMAIPTAATAVVSSVALPDIGKASGVNSTLQRFGGVFGIAVVSVVFASFGHIGTPDSYLAGFRPALAVAGGLSLIGALVALGVVGRQALSVEQPEAVPVISSAA